MEQAQKPKVAVVTGASSGVGAATARALVQQGWHVIALGKTRERLNATIRAIRDSHGGARIDGLTADFESLKQIERVAQDIAALTPRVHVLINNAGRICATRQETEDGFELLFATNHLGPFLLTRRLLPLLRATKNARIINVSSSAHRVVRDMSWHDLQLRKRFTTPRAYGQSKLANLLFTRELARRVAADGMTVNAVHPGIVASNLARHGGRLLSWSYRMIKPFALTPAQGADTVVWLATSPEMEGRSGGYYIKRHAARSSRAARSDEKARRLWDITERLLASARKRV